MLRNFDKTNQLYGPKTEVSTDKPGDEKNNDSEKPTDMLNSDKDDTTADKDIPQAGENMTIKISCIIVSVVAIFALYKYKTIK